MKNTTLSNDPAIVRGIKTVGVGKKGSKDLEPELAAEIAADLKSGKVSPVVAGAFFGGLFNKGIAPAEVILEDALEPGIFQNISKFVNCLSAEAPEQIKQICVRLLQNEALDRATAYQLGKFLLSNEPGEGARGLAVSILRVRYETADEYAGLLKSFQESLAPNFSLAVRPGEPVIQIAEPFDGVDHSYLITPLLAKELQTRSKRVISLVGRNSGPKFGNNLLDLCRSLNIQTVKSNIELAKPKQTLGWYFDQKDMSPALDRWVERRHQIIKRPCFATLEKFLDPVKAEIIITSAFHPPYSEKMTTIAEEAGFPGSIVVRNGLEGTIAFPLKREVKLLCSSKQKDGTYLRHEITFDPAAYLQRDIALEEVLQQPSCAENARLIKMFAEQGRTDNELFDLRVKATCQGIQSALQWITHNKGEI